MNALVEMGPVFGLVALCAALGLSRATYYRLRHAASAASGVKEPSPSIVNQTNETMTNSSEPLSTPCAEPTLPVDGPGVPAGVVGEPKPLCATSETREAILEARGASEAPESLPVVVEATIAPASTSTGVEASADPVENPARPTQSHLDAGVVVAAPKKVPRALSKLEEANVLGLLNDARFYDLSPAEVYATLLDEGCYVCSERTMYRILAAHDEVRDRRNQQRHPVYAAPELMATGPNQVWTWDITKLRGPAKGEYFYLYVILDLYSRYVVGWMVSASESGEQAEQFIADTYARHGVTRDHLTLHADRGSSMKSKTVALLLADLGVIKSHSRPYVSDDNPYSEAQFKTLKYRPDFPDRFGSLEDARAHCQRFFTWYNVDHHHVGIGLLTPHDVFHGEAQARLDARAVVLEKFYTAHPDRFVNRPPRPLPLPSAVWINKPKGVSSSNWLPQSDQECGKHRCVSTIENANVRIGSRSDVAVLTSERPLVEIGSGQSRRLSTGERPIVEIGPGQHGGLSATVGEGV